MTPAERITYAARLLDEGLPILGNEQVSGFSDAQMLGEILRWNSVAAMAQAHVAVALAQHTSVLTTVTDHVVQNAEPWQRSEIRPCPGNTAHVGHRHYDDGLGEWWCPGKPQPPTLACGLHNNWPHDAHTHVADGAEYWCTGKSQ